MQFTFNCPENIYGAIQRLADRHGVKKGTVINLLVKRGLLTGYFVPFSPVPTKEDLKALVKGLDADPEASRNLIHDVYGIDTDKMSAHELSEFAMMEGIKLAQFAREQFALEKELAAIADGGLDAELAALCSEDELESALGEIES